jgi:hypothetical protein
VAGSDYDVIGGGQDNMTGNGGLTFIGGGRGNSIGNASGYSVICGGYDNDIAATSPYSAILGGYNNDMATGGSYYSVILGGEANDILASADYALAGGRRAQNSHGGTFLWADSTDADFASAVANEFAVRATGGVRLVTDYTTTVDDDVDSFTDAGDWINIAGHPFANGDQVRLTTTGTLPGGLAIDTDSWIINNDGAKFNLSIAPNSTTVRTFSGTGSGTATVKKFAKTGARIDTAGVLQADGGYKSADGTAGMTDTRSWDDADGNTHAVTIKNGLITAWTVTPP